MGILSFFGLGKAAKEPITFAPGTTVEQANEILAAKLDSKAEIEQDVFDILQWAQEHKAKDKSMMKVCAFGFDKYGAELTPTQKGIIARLEALNLRATIQEENYLGRSGRYQNRWLEVSW